MRLVVRFGGERVGGRVRLERERRLEMEVVVDYRDPCWGAD